MQIASTVIEEGGEARTISLCLCFNEKLVQQGKQSLKSKEWREIVERKAHRGRLWKIFGSETFLRGMWEYYILRRAWARRILADAAREKQEGIQGQWQPESPFKEVLEQVKKKCGYRLQSQTMRRASIAKKTWQMGEFFWWSAGKKESSVDGVMKGFTRLMTKWQWQISAAWAHCVRNPDKSTYSLRQIIASRRNGRSHFVVLLPALQLLPFG